MARRRNEERREEESRPKLSRSEIVGLVFRTYAVSLPYVLIFVAVMLIATWLVTAVIFR